jgi:ABC-type spermidine/putrescine transport system permease subunit II
MWRAGIQDPDSEFSIQNQSIFVVSVVIGSGTAAVLGLLSPLHGSMLWRLKVSGGQVVRVMVMNMMVWPMSCGLGRYAFGSGRLCCLSSIEQKFLRPDL